MDLPLEEQIAWYRRRGRCEKRIGDLKWEVGLRVIPADFRTHRLKTLRFRLLGIPALVISHARRLWPELPRGHPHAAVYAATIA